MAISAPERKKAIAYYRHSAEDKQENSVPIQRAHSEKFGEVHHVDIIHEEADEGKSGLSASRPGFERLFNDWILNTDAPAFDYVFVYDVSRWGRFQDQDEAAYYEFRCKQRGKKVIYVSRGFPKEEEQLISHLQTSIERYMAAEYSRQLSEKVFYGCVKVSEQGYSAGGLPAYGMSRLLLDANKQPIKKLKKGEWKSISNERVTFTPAADETTAAVQEMFTLLVEKWESPKSIAGMMNNKGVLTAQGKQWRSQGVLNILTNEVYTGTRIYNKTWGRLKQKQRRNPRNEWVIHRDAFPHIVTADLFKDAQEHLYWLMPSKWRKGAHAIRRAALNLQGEIAALLLQKGMTVDEADMTIQRLPVALGVCFYLDAVPHWCFVVKEYMKNHDYVLGVSLAIDRKEPVDRFFWIPITSFDATDFIIFSEKDACCAVFTIQRDAVEEKILSLIGIREKTQIAAEQMTSIQ